MSHVLLEVLAKEYSYHILGISPNTPLYDTWSSVSREKGWGVIHVEMVWSGVMCSWVMLIEVVNKIFLTWVPMNNEFLLCNLNCNPKLLHFHDLWALFLERVISNSSGCGIITKNNCYWLGVSHFFKNEMDDFPSLASAKCAPSSASAAKAVTNRRRDVRMYISPFNFIGCLSWSKHPKRKCPAAWLEFLVHWGKRHLSEC